MKKSFIFGIWIIFWTTSSAQIVNYKRLETVNTLIESGEFKNFYKYDIGDYSFFNGRFENNLNFKIQENRTLRILYSDKDTSFGAMILKPKFFMTERPIDPIIVLVEVASEYSWGQKVLMIANGKVFNIGFLHYCVRSGDNTSIANYCNLRIENNKIIMFFDDIPLVNHENEKEKLNGKDLKFELSENKIERK